jgi:hypothetical protein
MRRLSVLLLLALLLTSCTHQMALSPVKEGLSCWNIRRNGLGPGAHKLGPPDILPAGSWNGFKPERLGYNDTVVTFYTKREQVKEDGKIRFKEVVYKSRFARKSEARSHAQPDEFIGRSQESHRFQ